MNLITKTTLTLLGLGAACVAQATDFDDYARVVSVAPQMEQVNQPRQECHTEYVPVQQRQQRGDNSPVGGIIGGIAGGLLGNQVGGGNGRTVATAAGAITGALVGNSMQNQEPVVTTSEQAVRQCRNVDHWEQRANGFLVTYEYHGRTISTLMPYDPGERLRLRVSLVPR